MNLADWVAIVIVLFAAVGGMRRGLVLSALSLVGLAGGAYRGVGIADCVRSGEAAAESALGIVLA